MASRVLKIWLLFLCLKNDQKFPFEPWAIVHGGQKVELAQEFIQVEVDLKRMQTNFGGRGLSSFGDFVLFMIFRKWPKFRTMGSKNRIGSKIHASRG